jgi:hypothetical protein
MPTDSPTLGLGHLRFEALLTTARLSANRNDFALIAMLGLLGPRTFEACGANIADAEVSLRDVQIAARHADPKTTMRYDRARKNLDRHPHYILAAYTASGT